LALVYELLAAARAEREAEAVAALDLKESA
jgi:hypothetical protein